MRSLLVLVVLAPLLAASMAVPSLAVVVPDGARASVMTAASATTTSSMPTRKRWRAQVRQVMTGSGEALHQRLDLRADGERLALNLDNTTLMTHYRTGAPVRRVRAFAHHAERHDVAILFNSARWESGRDQAVARLTAAGYPVDGLCLRQPGESVLAGKHRCREEFREAGYTLVFNIGNRSTDFEGEGYERALKLPDYGLRLR